MSFEANVRIELQRLRLFDQFEDPTLAAGPSFWATSSTAEVGRRIIWQGKGVEETGIEEATGKDLIRVDARYFRPTEVDELVGDASKAAKRLGWRPTKSLKELVAEMVHSDLETSRMRPGAKTAALMSS